MHRTLLLAKIAAWTWTIAIYCCLAERVAAALWMSCTPAQAVKALGWFLSIEKGVTFDKIQFVLLPVILWLMHNKRLGEIFASFPMRFRHSSLILSTMNAVSIFIVIAAIPRIVDGGIPALPSLLGIVASMILVNVSSGAPLTLQAISWVVRWPGTEEAWMKDTSPRRMNWPSLLKYTDPQACRWQLLLQIFFLIS